MRRLAGASRHWWWRLFVVLVVVEPMTQLPVWTVFLPAVVASVLPAPRDDGRAPVTLSPPVGGRWVMINGPGTRVPSHGTRHLGQAFAVDILHPTEAGDPITPGWGLRQRDPSTYSCFGEPVHAAGRGRVVVHDRRRDHRGRNTWPGILFMMAVEPSFRLVGGPSFVLGNHVVVEHADGTHALYAHLRRGSARVRAGDEVEAGQVLAEVGNSGNTSEPHLHFQLMDRPRATTAAGLPFVWSDVEVEPEADTRWRPDREHRSRVVGMPGNGRIVDARPGSPSS